MGTQTTKTDKPLPGKLTDLLSAIQSELGSSADLVQRNFTLRLPEGKKGTLFYIDGMADSTVIQNGILEPIHRYPDEIPDIDALQEKVLNATDCKRVSTFGDVYAAMFSGLTPLFLDGSSEALLLNTIGGKSRSIEEPSSEPVIRGPRDGFTEVLRTNTALLRRRLRNPKLRLEELRVGRETQTILNIAYMENLVKEGLVEELKRRINRISIDSILESGYIEELIDDNPLSPFVTIQSTERPDKVASSLLEGRAAIFVDGTPYVIIVPATFWMFIQASDDYYSRYYVGSFFRLLRIVAFLISLTFPSIYVLISSFHQEMMPTALALTIASGREVVPFPVLFEVLLMELFFELMREAGLRMPRPIGSAVSIVGSLVIGQAAVQAGVVGPFAVIVVAVTGISSFAVPNYSISFAIRIIRFPLLIASGILGLLGFGGIFILLLMHLLSLKTFGVPYLEPLSPFRPSEQKDIILRVPWWSMLKRPRIAEGGENRERQDAKPDPTVHLQNHPSGSKEEESS